MPSTEKSARPWITPEVQALLATITDPQVTIATVYGEARSEPIEGMIAVANVIRNRVHDPRWGQTYRSVCLAPWQFSCWNAVGGGRNLDRVVALVRQFAQKQTITDPVVRELTYLVHGIVHDGWLRDTTKGATHYHVATMQPRPQWAQAQTPTCQRASHVFYAGVK